MSNLTVPEVEEALETMVVLVDNREQPTQRAKARYEQFQCPYERTTLKTGDYSVKFKLPSGEWFSLEDSITVERKMDIDELCMCYGQHRQRFIKEFERLKENNIRMWLLIENSTFKKMYEGKYRSKYKPKSLIASLLAWQARYNCRIVMCDEGLSGALIRDILFYEGREILMGMVDE